jgi:ABC-type transport system substrate-binding protein
MTYRKYTGSLSKRYGPYFRLFATHLPGERGSLTRMLVGARPDSPQAPAEVEAPLTWRYSLYLAFTAAALSCVVLAVLTAGIAARATSGGAARLGAAAPLPDTQQALRYPLPGSGWIRTVDPALATDPNELQAAQLLFPGLVTLDDNLRPIPWAAQRIDLSADGRTYTFQLRPGLAWSDGAPIDASTFAYAINRALHPCTRSLVAFYLYPIKDAVRFNTQRCGSDGSAQPAPGQTMPALGSLVGDSIVVRDPHILVLTLAQPVAYFLAALAYPTAYAVPRQLVDRFGSEWIWHLTDNGGSGGGMFILKTWGDDGHLVLARNDRYWGAHPRLRELDLLPAPDARAGYSDYRAGKTPVGFAPPDAYAAARSQAGFAETGLLQIDYFGLSWASAPFDDIRMRQAFALALDKVALAGALRGMATPTNHIVPQGMPGYDASIDGPDGSTGLAGDPTKARTLATQYAHDKCGGDLAHCPAVVLTIPTGDASAAALAQAALGMWHATFPGYPVAVDSVDQGTLLGALTDHSLQLWYLNWIGDYCDPQDWLTNQFLPGTAYNDGQVDLSDATRLMLAADITRDPTERMQRYAAAEQLLVSNVAWIPLVQPKLWWETAPGVVGLRLDGRGMSTLDVWQQVYLTKR